jgi:hypothetical protein
MQWSDFRDTAERLGQGAMEADGQRKLRCVNRAS